VRAGGKHNDLENVGFTKRHHTFFEMLGNFSFGDYFKQKAIPYAWELITSSASGGFAIPKDKLYVTIFGGAEVAPGTTLGVDEDARKFWLAEKVPAERIVPVPGLKENFWAMGDTGPCGPCSEIHYDMGPEASEQGHPDCKFPCDCGRYVEIWNLVFMQFNRDASGKLTPLPRPSIDTGMGLERVAATLLNLTDSTRNSNYETDLFVPLMKRAAELLKVDSRLNPNVAPSLRIIADHARATTFLMSDGVLPSNEGRGYVLRKIMRRAIRHGHMWGAKEPFLFKMVDVIRDEMRSAYPELIESAPRIAKAVEAEERQFGRAIEVGSEKLEELLKSTKAEAQNACLDSFSKATGIDIDRETAEKFIGYLLPGNSLDARRKASETLVGNELEVKLLDHFDKNYHPRLPGAKTFNLYETYGLPRDFIEDAAKDHGVLFDEKGFDAALDEERTRARASWKGGAGKEAANPAYAKIAV
jgi:alanyl-tRNA synthetase